MLILLTITLSFIYATSQSSLPLIGISHNLYADDVRILKDGLIFITNLTYDGLSPDAYFWIGKNNITTKNGMKLADETGSKQKLKGYKNADIVLTFPASMNVEWVAVLCELDDENIGFVNFTASNLLNKNASFVVLESFLYSKSASLRSGPILMIDDWTFYITNFNFINYDKNVCFWAGDFEDGFQEGYALSVEGHGSGLFGEFNGVDLYVRVPLEVRRTDFDYLGVKDRTKNGIIAYSKIPPVSLGVVKKRYKEDRYGNFIARVPKCCPPKTKRTPKGCTEMLKTPEPLKVYSANESYYDDEPMQNVIIEWYTYKPNCTDGMYYLEIDENFSYLSSGQLFFPDEGEIVTNDGFCFDLIKANEDLYHVVPFLCINKQSERPEYWNRIIAAFIYVSAFFLILTTAVFTFVKEARNIRGYNIIGYTGFMAISFIILASARLSSLSESNCTLLGFFYQFFLVGCFTWLAILTFDTFTIDSNRTKIFFKYLIISFLVPTVAVILSVIFQGAIPSRFDKPSSNEQESCAFRNDRKVIFFYFPCFNSIVFCIVVNILIKIKIYRVSDTRFGSSNFMNVFRSNYMILGIMIICWSSALFSYFFETNGGIWLAIDVLDSLQGLFIFAVYILHEPVYSILMRHLKCAGNKGKKLEQQELGKLMK